MPGAARKSWRRAEHELEAVQHRRHQQPDEPHVVVQRQPRHRAVLGPMPGGLDDRVDVLDDAAVGEHHALGSAVDPLVNWRIARRSGSSAGSLVLRASLAVTRRRPSSSRPTGEGVARRGGRNGASSAVDEHHRGVGVHDAPPGLVDELFDRAEAHRQRQGHDGAARQPDRLQRGDQRAGSSARGRHVRSRVRRHAPGARRPWRGPRRGAGARAPGRRRPVPGVGPRRSRRT